MAIRAVLPLLVGAGALLILAAGCRQPATPVHVDAAPGPVLLTRFLETRPVAAAPPPPTDLKSAPAAAGPHARREGGVPEALNVGDDCSVHAVWWVAHLCGLTAKGDARWEDQTGWALTSVKLQGTARTDCQVLATRFETVITGLANGSYRFGTSRKYVEFVIACAKGG